MDRAKRSSNPWADVAPPFDHEIVRTDVHDTQRDGRVDEARGRANDAESGQRQCHCVGQGKGRDHPQPLTYGASKKQEPDQKEQVVGSE